MVWSLYKMVPLSVHGGPKNIRIIEKTLTSVRNLGNVLSETGFCSASPRTKCPLKETILD